MREICTFGSVRGGGGNIPAYSAQAVAEHVELAGVVGDDGGVAQQAVRGDRADERGLGDDAAPAADVKAGQVRLPGGLIGEALMVMANQGVDHRCGHRVLDHVGFGGGVDQVVRPARSNSRKFSRLLDGRVANQAKRSSPVWLVVWLVRAPVCRPKGVA